MSEQKSKILIAEDSKAYLMVLSEGFNIAGFEVIEVENGQDGLEAVKKNNFDFIISDINMPVMDGIEMVKKIRESGVNVPVIFLTNLSDMQHIGSAIEAAVNADYVIKSDITVDGIVQRIKDKLKTK